MILFQLIQKPQLRGAEMFACQLSGHLEKLGHTVIVIALFPGAEKLPFKGKIIQLNRPISRRWFDYNGWKELSLLVQQYQPDIIQCNAGDTLKFAVLSKLFFKWDTPIIARNASMVSLYIKNPIAKWINRQLYKKVSRIVSVSEQSKKNLNALFPETTSKSIVIPVGIETTDLHEVSWKDGKNADLHIIHVGGFTFEKNHEGLVRIFNQFLQKRPQAHLHLLGDGPKRKEIEALSKTMEIDDKITFYGFVSNPIDYVHKAHALVLPSIIEGLPGVLLEAMYAKTVTIAYNVGGISEIIENKTTGFLVPKNDESAFVESMILAIQENQQDILANAHKQVVQKYSNDYLAKAFQNVYSEIKNEKN